MVNSRSTLPKLLGQGPRDIEKHIGGLKAKEAEAMLVRDASILFCDIPNLEPYLRNFLMLKEIYLRSKKWGINEESLVQIGVLCRAFVQTYEKLYYFEDPVRMNVCLINNHALLHLGMFTVLPN